MKRENLKKDYEIREMKREEIQKLLEENQNLKLMKFEDEEDFFMIRENKKSLFIIHQISEEKKERRILDKDIKIDSRDLEEYHIKLIYHRMKDNSKEYRIFISFKDENKKLIRRRLRNEKIDSISKDEKKMIEYYQNLSKREIKEKIS